MTDLEVDQQLNEAIRVGDLAKVSSLIVADVSRLNMMTVFGTWLHVAATWGQFEIVKWLVEAGADVNACGGPAGGGALHCAASDGYYDIVQYLLDHGAVLDVSEPERNPLIAAITDGHTAIAKLLIDRGININVRYGDESKVFRDALAFAHGWGRMDIEKYLVAHGAVVTPEKTLHAYESAADEIIAYFAARFGPVDPIALGEIIPSTDPPIIIHRARATEKRNSEMLFTTGMSDRAMEVTAGGEKYRYAELLIELPADWPLGYDALGDANNRWPVDWLRRAASYPHADRTWLNGPVAIMANSDPPSPLAPACGFTSIMLMIDHGNDGPIRLSDGREVQVYTLFPLYEDERQLEISHGLPELFRRLDQFGIGRRVDLSRPNVAALK
jgi:hypothetical protein